MRDWLGRSHVETLRAWSELRQVVERVESQPESFAGALLIGSLARGEGDALSDVDLIAVTHENGWQRAWERRTRLSEGALITFDRFEEGKNGVAGHSWLTPSLVKVECLVALPRSTRLAGHAVVVAGDDQLLEAFEKRRPFTRREVEDYAGDLRKTGALSDVERAYGDLIQFLRRDAFPRQSRTAAREPLPRGRGPDEDDA
jgi:predicted nucleotidyltransferase